MPPSSNWSALKKSMGRSVAHSNHRPTKRRKIDISSEGTTFDGSAVSTASKPGTAHSEQHGLPPVRDSPEILRKMVRGEVEYPPAHLLPGKYLAIDCEMVGIAGDPKDPSLPGKRHKGDESSLARVSVVNYHGVVQLDAFVRQRERVTDWRTAFSGIRESDMVNAKPFSEVQKLVADLLKNKILVGHAVHNDLKVLLLSHPYNMTRDTQVLAGSRGTLTTSKAQAAAASSSSGTAIVSTRRDRKPALRKLVSQELGIEIQTGEHSSVIDARATMAIYRLHRRIWDQGFKAAAAAHERKQLRSQSDGIPMNDVASPGSNTRSPSVNRKRSKSQMAAGSDDDAAGVVKQPKISTKTSGGNGKGISSGLSVVINKRRGSTQTKHVVAGTRGSSGIAKDNKWWGTLDG